MSAPTVSRSSFILGAVSNWLAFAATLAVSFFLTPYLIGALGAARYDVWCVAESVLAYFTLLDMGVAACLVRSIARSHAADDREGVNRVVSSCLVVFLAAGLAALTLGVPVLLALSMRFESRVGGDGALPFLLMMLANLAMTLPMSIFPSILDGLERFAAKSVVRVIFLLARTVGIIAVMRSDKGLLPLAAVYTVANLAEHVVLAMMTFRFLPGLRLSWRFVDRATLRQVRGYSGDAFLAMLAGRVTVQTGAILVGLFLPPGAVTAYATAARLVEYAKTMLRTVTTTLTPGVSAMEARNDWVGVRRVFLSATRWVLYLVLPVNVGLWLFGRPFLTRWVGVDIADSSFPAVAILAATLSVGVAQSVASRILYGLGRLRLFARLALVEAALNLLLTAALVGPLGVEGVAIAVAIPNILFCGVVLAYTARQLGVSGHDYGRAWAKPIAATVVPLVVWRALGEPIAAWPAIAAVIAAGLVPYAVVVAIGEGGGRLIRLGRLVPRAIRPSPHG